MNRTDLVHATAGRAAVDAATADAVLTALADELEAAMRRGDTVRWPGVVVLDVVERAARTGRNPATGEPLDIPARRSPPVAGSRRPLRSEAWGGARLPREAWAAVAGFLRHGTRRPPRVGVPGAGPDALGSLAVVARR